MLTRVRIALAFAFASGCGQVHQISVGSAAQELDLGSCFGQHTDCEAAPDLASAMPLDALEPEECAPTEEAAWHVVWQRDVNGVPCPPIGQCNASLVRLAADGSVWTAGTATVTDGDGMTEGFFLGHYGKNGEVLAEEVVDSRHARAVLPDGTPQAPLPNVFFPLNPELAVLANGDAVMGVDWSFVGRSDPPWLIRYDRSGHEVGERIPVLGLGQDYRLRVGPGTDEGLILSVQPLNPGSAEAKPGGQLIPAPSFGAIAKLDRQLNPVWVQLNGPAWSQPQMSADRNGRISAALLTVSWSDPGRGLMPEPKAESQSTWLEYDAHGNPTTIRALDFQHLWAFDREGNALASRTTSDPTADNPDFTISKFSARGEALWSRHMAAIVTPDGFHVPLVVAPDGTAYVGGVATEANALPTSVLYHIDPNGENCGFARVEGLGERGVQALFFTPAGELYFSTGASVGRLAR